MNIKASCGRMGFYCRPSKHSCEWDQARPALEARWHHKLSLPPKPRSKTASIHKWALFLHHGPCLSLLCYSPCCCDVSSVLVKRQEKYNTAAQRKVTYPARWQSLIFDSVQHHPGGWKLHRCRNQCLKAACWRSLLMRSLDLSKLWSCP